MSNLLKPTRSLFAAAMLLSGCSAGQDSTPAVSAQGGITRSALQEQTPEAPALPLREESEVREGTSIDTLATPEDFPAEYNYGSGLASDWSSQASARLPEPEGNATVLNTIPDLTEIQALYLWEEGNAPAQTEVTRDGYDPADFRPYVTAIPVRKGTEVKGAVVLLAGGEFQARANYTDTLPTAAHLRELGFQTFIVDYRLRPYTQQEGALDVARAVRFIRKNADAYGIDPDDIAVMGYSAGGIQAGEFFLNFDENVLPTVLDPDYVPDELDEVSAHASATHLLLLWHGGSLLPPVRGAV